MQTYAPIAQTVEQLPDGTRRITIAAGRSPSNLADSLVWRVTHRQPVSAGIEAVEFGTNRGNFSALYHSAASSSASAEPAIVWVGGAGDGVDGPAHGLYPTMCERLAKQGIAGLRLSYRHAGELTDCVLDTLLGITFLEQEAHNRVALVGHSFGGAVVITAGAISPSVRAVVPLASQTYGTQLVRYLAPRALFLVHGLDDEILPPRCSEQIYEAASEPKTIRLFPQARHGLDSVRDELVDLLTDWLPRHLRSDQGGQTDELDMESEGRANETRNG